MVKGHIHTVEAVMAGMILLSFIIVVYSQIDVAHQSIDEKRFLYSILERDNVRRMALEGNLTGLESFIRESVPFNTSVGIVRSDVYEGSQNLTFSTGSYEPMFGLLEVSGSGSAEFNGNSLDLINDEVWIGKSQFQSVNTLNVTGITYRLYVFKRILSSPLPEKNVIAVTYDVSGFRNFSEPVRVVVYEWYE
ncbi:MAG: hypothetical protein DRP11_03695 [Candidatus Aenigmatarchaeota archaeon]|mgnify:CR=1 FL=1|nr:MAG: hypothetical protein DRP11_03695 [Candidatus Aenigmarchaeota archaeon]